jgi:DNA topoisomerase-1
VGCEGYPECDQTYPLPQRGDIIGTDEVCPQCGTPKIKVLGGRRPWILCLDPHCPTKAEYRERQAARLAGGKTTGRRATTKRSTTTKATAAAKRSTTTKKSTTAKKSRSTGKETTVEKGAAAKKSALKTEETPA